MSLETYGSYQLIKRLATGGMAQIYLARQTGLEGFEKLLVVKRILPHLAENEEFVRMFLDEARIAARLNHPNVVQIFNLGQQDDSFFIAMEYIHGEDARRVWKRADQRGTPLPLPLVCRVVMDACAGLDYAHKKADPSGNPLNIVHRDISPQNILVTFEGGVKVVDFGIAKAADQATVTRSGVLKGKYSYMSPEQAAGKRVDCRSDVFALGVVLYELLTGTRLFKRASDVQTLNAVIACEVVPPSQVNARVPVDLDPIVLKALAKEPENRFQEAIHLQLALEDWLVQRRMPSSSAHLAAFMQEIYSDRLAREASEGHVVVDDPESVSSKQREGDEGSPQRARGQRPPTPRPTTSLKAPPVPPPLPAVAPIALSADTESTLSERPLRREKTDEATRSERSLRDGREPSPVPRRAPPTIAQTPRARASAQRPVVRPEPGEMSLTENTIDERRKPSVPTWLWAVLVAFLLGGIGFLAWPIVRPVKPVAVAPQSPAPVRPALARVRVDSNPSGASVTFEGKVLAEKTPCVLPQVAAGSYEIALALDGYQPFRTTVAVPSTGELALPTFSLLPVPKPEVVARPSGDNEPAQPVKGAHPGRSESQRSAHVESAHEVRPTRGERRVRQSEGTGQDEPIKLERSTPPAPANGTVAFVVVPWADVTCGSFAFGDTPFSDKSMPAGSYDCTFVNPQLGKRTRTIAVRPNARTVVTVKFTDSP